MDYFDSDGNYNRSKVINGIVDIDNQIQEEVTKDKVDGDKVTRLRFEQMLRGLYLWDNPFNVI